MGWQRLGASVVFASLLASCGGEGEQASVASASSTSRPTTVNGTIFPAAAGVVFIEYDADGAELQRSTPSDRSGRFVFAAPLSGERIRSRTAVDSMTSRLPVDRAALVVDGADSLEVNPLTTLLEQFTAAGQSRVSALRAVRRLSGSCGTEAAAGTSTAAQGLTTLGGDAREALLRAFDAYTAAFRRIGLGAQIYGAEWSTKLQQRRELLTQMCDASRALFSADWPANVAAALSAGQSADKAMTADNVRALRQDVAGQVLNAIGARLASVEYPELASALRQSTQSWTGTDSELALKLVQLAWSGPSNGGVAEAGVSPGTASALVDMRGVPVRALFGSTVSVNGAVPIMRFENHSDSDRRVGLSINSNFLPDWPGLIEQVIAMPAQSRTEPLWERAWRFVVEWRQHTDPISGGRFLHQPDLFLRSIGSGYCDDVATVLHWIWRGLGYEARVYGLDGHVVAEIKVNERWAMYDPDYGVYYLNRAGAVASVAELADDGTLITAPQRVLTTAAVGAYSPEMANYYTTQENNQVAEWLSVPPEHPYGNEFLIPRNGYMEIVGGATYAMPTMYGGPGVNLAPIRVWFPPGYTGVVALPMVLADAQGDASISLLWMPQETSPAGVSAAITAFHLLGTDIGINEVTITRVGPGGLTLTLMANPRYFKSTGGFSAGVRGTDLSGLAIVGPVRQVMTN